jgi:glycosyltransferase involved in cell wall biosynthesis
MVKDPLVSVIIPCYNVGEFVENAVQSILKQTYSNLEIWLIDDASTDNTLAQIMSIKDKRIRVVRFSENTKKIGAVNTVLKQVKGNFIAFQDADDWSEPDRIRKQLEAFFNNPDLGICFTNYRLRWRKRNRKEKVALTDEELRDEFLEFGHRKIIDLSPTICATMMIKKEVLESTKGYHEYFTGKVAEDIHWVYRILRSYKGITINKQLYNINYRQESLTAAQISGVNPKAAYMWKLLAKIIYKDINEGVDLLDSNHIDELRTFELISCEEALSEAIKLSNETRKMFETSWSYRLGRFLLRPFHLFKR